MVLLTSPRLTRHEVAAYRRDGFLFPAPSIAPAMVARLAAIVGSRPVAGGQPALDDPVAAWALDAGLAELVTPLLGSGAWLWRCAALFRAPHAPELVPWHQGGAAAPGCPDGTVVVRVAIDGADHDNGCLRLLPRPHERLVRAIRNARDRRRLAVPPDRIDRAITVEAACQPGALTLFDSETFRCEPENRSGRPRRAVVFDYAPGGPRADEPAAR